MQFIFLCNSPKSLVIVSLIKILKSTVHKKSNCVFLYLRWRKHLKVAAFVIFPTSIMVLLEIRQRFKDHFFNESRVFFKGSAVCQPESFTIFFCPMSFRKFSKILQGHTSEASPNFLFWDKNMLYVVVTFIILQLLSLPFLY